MPNNLPLARTSFVGRASELAELEKLLCESAIVTVVGTGGVGKTRLALELTHRLLDRFPAGVWLADLSSIPSPELAVTQVARLVGVTPGSRDPVQLLTEQLGDRAVLLVLDNCEHLVEGVALLAHRLVTACPNVRVLATSREPLAVGPEVTFQLRPLEAGEAVRLFLDRARAADPGFAEEDADVAVVAALCAHLDSIPLAIELAAPWIRLFSAAELLPRLANRFQMLAATRRDLPPRQRTMRATVEWSHQLLQEPPRVLFRRLAIFNGNFSLEAAERVGSSAPLAPERIGALLAGLRERSMVVAERSPRGPSRFRLLETLREFAGERLGDSGEAPALQRRHFAYYLERAERIDGQRLRTGSDAEIPSLVPDGDNYRAALEWSIENDPPGALRLAAALEGFWMIRSVAEGRTWLQRALERAPGPTRHRARALIVSPLVVAGGIPWPEAREMVRASIGIYESAGDEAGAALARAMMSLGAFFNGELAEAQRCAEDARLRHSRLDQPLFHARAATYLGSILSFTPRRLEEGRRLLHEGLDRSREIEDRWGQGMALTILGLADLRAGHREPARQHLRTALRTNLQAGVTAAAVGGLGQLAAGDDPQRALTLLEAASVVLERTGVPRFPVHVGQQLERSREAARRRVAPRVAEQCRARARALTTEEALAYALAEGEPSPGGEADRLTARQQEVALLVAEGLSNREISERLYLSVRTVETHINNVMAELDLHSRVRLAGWAREVGLADSAQ